MTVRTERPAFVGPAEDAEHAEEDRAAVARVEALLRAALEVSRDPALRAPLVRSTGLSPEGVRLGLSRYLEKDVPPAALAALVRKSARAPCVHVILSANVFTAPLRALVVASLASARVSVRPSRRDPIFTRALVRAVDAPWLSLAEAAEVATIAQGEVHAYGRDETVSAVRRAARPGVVVRVHGAGLGVALIGPEAQLAVAARDVADDVVAFDQRGCLSARVVFVLGGERRADGFGERLSEALAAAEATVPRGRLDPNETRDAARYRESMAFAGRVLVGASHVVGVAKAGGPLSLPPPGRHVHVAPVASVDDVRQALAPIAGLVVALGCDDAALGNAVGRGLYAGENSEEARGRVRVSTLGQMQLPPLDGPVDLR